VPRFGWVARHFGYGRYVVLLFGVGVFAGLVLIRRDVGGLRERPPSAPEPSLVVLLIAVVSLLAFHMSQGAVWTLIANSPMFSQQFTVNPALLLACSLLFGMLGSLYVLSFGADSPFTPCIALTIAPLAIYVAYSVVPPLQFVIAAAYIAFVWNLWSAVLMGAISRASNGVVTSVFTSYTIRLGSVLGPLAVLPFASDIPRNIEIVTYSTILYAVALGCYLFLLRTSAVLSVSDE
jgi:hypothetical protein